MVKLEKIMSKKADLGLKGELLAAKYLSKKGYEVLETNYRYRHAEIDIITKTGGLLVFVEVKTRSKINFGYPEEAVDQKKAAKVIEGADQYIVANDWKGDVRFDIISVLVGDQVEIQHFEDAFY
jgi:putative endonuclease